jgi:hypothetical protein
VQQLLVGEDSKLTASTQLPFEIQGDQGDAWRKGVLALQSTNQSFRVKDLISKRKLFYKKFIKFLFNFADIGSSCQW